MSTLKSKDEVKKHLEECVVLTDGLSVELMKRICSPHSPMAVSDLPIRGFPRDIALARLYQLEKLGALKSRLDKRKENYIRIFEGTPQAKWIVEIIKGK